MAQSCSILCSAGDSLSQKRLLIWTGLVAYTWLVALTNFCTSYILFDMITEYGFSWPSTALLSSALYSSANGIGSGLAVKVLKVSRNTGFGITRSFRPSRSSALVMGRLPLVTLRKPRSKKPSTTTPFSASLPLSILPSGPSTMASACWALLKRNGKSNRPNSLTMPASDVVDATSISCTPPCIADCCCSSLPNWLAANSCTLILPPLLAATSSANFLTPALVGWSVLFRWPNRIVRSWMSCAAAMPPAASRRSIALSRINFDFMVRSVSQNGVRILGRHGAALSMIRGTTALIAHIGWPTHAFKAPMIYNPYFERAGIDAVVVPMGCRDEHYPAFLRAVFTLENIRGALITMPHKASTVALLDRRSPAVQIAGACNAVRRDGDGRLVGDLFDGEGFVRGLRRNGCGVEGARALVVGAGGVGSAIAASLAQAGAATI